MTKRYKNKAHRAMNDMNWDWSNDGYEYSEPHKKFRRNKIDGVIGGVCAGIGDYIGIFVLLVVFTGFPLIVYPILWIFVPKDTRAPYVREYREARRARRENPSEPVRTANFRDVKSKYRSLETRLQDLERNITSKEWKLNREFRDL